MDLLYSRYSNPLEFMRIYIDQGRFGEFVSNLIEMENKRKIEVYEKENEDMLFQMYVHSFSKMSFAEWKKKVLANTSGQQVEKIDKEQVVSIVNNSTNILESFNLEE